MIGKPRIRITTIALLLLGLLLFGWLGAAPAAHADSPDSRGSELSGYVFADLNVDGIFTPTEPGIADVEIVLTMFSDPNIIISMLSDINGYYKFIGLDAGIYSITQPAFPLGVRNTYVSVGELHDISTGDPLSSDPGTAMLLDQAQGILPHIEGIDLPDGAMGSNYNFGQIYLGKAWWTTDPPPIIPEGGVPEPSTCLLLAFGGLLLGSVGHRRSRR
jgi:SdrD B-like protein